MGNSRQTFSNIGDCFISELKDCDVFEDTIGVV